MRSANESGLAFEVFAEVRRHGARWLYFTTAGGAFGRRQVGDDWLCVVDDFGDLVAVERVA